MKKKFLSAIAMVTWLIIIGVFMLLARRVDFKPVLSRLQG